MPIYDWQCGDGHFFELLAAASEVNKRRRCPSCGAKSQRVISTFAIHGGAPIPTASERAAAREVDVTSLKLPNFARLCAMDDYSATRLAAHKVGRGTEFDDKMAARKEVKVARSDPAQKTTAPHRHQHSH